MFQRETWCPKSEPISRAKVKNKVYGQIWPELGNRNSTQELRHKFQIISFISAQVIFLNYAEVNIRCRSQQVCAKVIPCRSYSSRTSVAPNCIHRANWLFLKTVEISPQKDLIRRFKFTYHSLSGAWQFASLQVFLNIKNSAFQATNFNFEGNSVWYI